MPLPANNTPWPPKEWQPITTDYATWEAWWTGDRQRLWDVYHGHGTTITDRQRLRGLAGMVQRFFWGRITQNNPHRPTRGDLHIPIAADLCATSADLLYATPPTVDADNATTIERLEAYQTDGLWEQMLAGAETGAALGGRYHRVTWDPTISAMPFVSTVDADNALPEFRWGRLVAVTFWTVLEQRGSQVIRHLERHELASDGLGYTFHGLYEGTTDNLGIMVPLTEHPTTEPLAHMVGMDGYITEGITPGLNVVYIPNVTPNRRWRDHQQARNLGRSDLDGVEPLMDALDEVYSAWMRDIRLGKARIFADRDMLETTRPNDQGQTSTVFDLDQEVFVPLDGLAGSMADAVPINAQQFAIRWQEHQATARELTAKIIRAARYSEATFEDTGDTDITATEVKARQASTMTTRGRKIRLETPALTQLMQKMLLTDQTIFGTPGVSLDGLKVEFPPYIQDSTESRSQTAATLKAAGLMSLETGVQYAHPEWDAGQVDEEVARIQQANPLISPDQWRPRFDEMSSADDRPEDR